MTRREVWFGVSDPSLERLLQLVVSELKADDARVELGGRPPSSPGSIFCQCGEARIVALFDSPPKESQLLTKRLVALCETFTDTVNKAASHSLGRGGGTDAQAQLEQALSAVATRAGSTRAVVCDLSAPLVWGSSVAQDTTRAADIAVVDSWVSELSGARAPELKSSHGHVLRLTLLDDHECLARLFGGTYVVSLYFESALSEPVAVGALLHAMPAIEKLVLALPPVDPPPGGKVVRLAPRMRRV